MFKILTGELVEKDFNIADEAGGVGMEVIKPYLAFVNNNTLEIPFYWAGKGTTSIPDGGVYGPLISAISVHRDLKGLDLQTGSFTLRQIRAATNNFDVSNKVGEDGAAIAVKQLSSKSKQGNREYMENNSLARALFGLEECQLKLDWTTRYKICVGIAKGLAYLHEESRLKIVHRDIKATNVLLDKYLNPKISNLGLAKLDEKDNTHLSTRIAGT
ncbi:hypothetical protein SO802_014985 [Lithocarpus litseifolius]|uniref:non-specific serine/threonine protein kinase n=1 Tax=Lithocarpus litseifolius TaxID=425828 RepID=A0AAW2CTR7_9ROSI